MILPLSGVYKMCHSNHMHAGIRFKWLVCGLLFLAVTILYMDRQLLSILVAARLVVPLLMPKKGIDT